MHNDKHYPFIKVSMTALALLVAPLALQAQDKAAEASQGTQKSLNVDAADQQAPGTTKTTDDASTGSGDEKKVASASQPATPLVPGTATWDSFHGQLNAQKYSPLTQITADNVGKLTKVWEFHTGDVSDGKGDTPATVWSATPIFANDTLYIGTPFDRLIALDPGTGKEKWHYDTKSSRKALTQPVLKNRGVSYWQAKNPVSGEACQKMVYMGTVDGKLFALDADSGKPCSSFADNGVLDLNQWNTVNAKYPLSVLQPPTVVGNHLLVGWAGKDWAYAEAPPGTVFSVNAQTGKLEWTFEAIPAEIRKRTGTANVWTHMSGKVVWSRQWVHHDVWDYDINSAPTLMDITVDGKQIPALVQATKQGFLFVVNRLTGEDVWPIEERPVPQGDGSVQGEVLSPTQPFPTKPAPLLDQSKKPEIWKLADIVGGGQCSRLWDNLTYEGMYTPPTTKGEGTLTYPDSAGGVQWGGVAFDPQKQIAIVNTSHIVQYVKLYSREDYDNADKDSGNESGFAPQEGAPYKVRAYSVESGEELWSDQAEAPAVANPSVYEYKGRQYVAFVAGGNTILKDQVGDQVVVYALPE